MTIKFGTAPGWECTEKAARVVELYGPKDGRAHGSLDGTLYVCEAHLERARNAQWDGPVTPYVRQGQTLSDRGCGYLVDFREVDSPEAVASDEATAEVEMPRDPVELEEQLAAAYDGLGEAVQARLDEESTEELTLFGTVLRLEIDGELTERGSLSQIRNAVAERVTEWLADDPEGLAADAQTCNLAFNTGAVQEAIDLRGEWHKVVGKHRVRITREG